MGMEIPVTKEEEEEEEEDGHVVVLTVEESEQQERQQMTADQMRELRALKARPSILVVGPPAVGKRSLLNRIVARGRSVRATTQSGATCDGWTIDTKYYTANVCMWMARFDNPALKDVTSINSEFGRCEALIMVFDLSNPTSFEQLQDWVTGVDFGNFEILLCVGNKADRVPEHHGHDEYRRKLQRRGESSSDPHPEFWDFGIDRTEGDSLLEEEFLSFYRRRRSCIEWCSDMGFEYIEACTINEVFDDCISVDGDLQGVARIHGALSAHMWPGLVMKDKHEPNDATSSNPEQDITSDDDSDYYIEYELLSNGSAEPFEGAEWEDQWSFSMHADEPAPESDAFIRNSMDDTTSTDNQRNESAVTTPFSESSDKTLTDEAAPVLTQVQTSGIDTTSNGHMEHPVRTQRGLGDQEVLPFDKPGRNEQKNSELEEMERLMGEMAAMRLNMRSMSDQHRREMAAQLAMRMASMFKDDEGEASDLE